MPEAIMPKSAIKTNPFATTRLGVKDLLNVFDILFFNIYFFDSLVKKCERAKKMYLLRYYGHKTN